MDAVDVDLGDPGDVVRVTARDRTEECPDELRHGLERDLDLPGRGEFTPPPVLGVDRCEIGARGEPGAQDPVHLPAGGLGVRVRRQDHAHRAPRLGGVHRIRAHAGIPLLTCTSRPEASIVTTEERCVGCVRSTTAARAGTAEMLRIF